MLKLRVSLKPNVSSRAADVTSQRDHLQAHVKGLEQALQILLPAADLSSSENLPQLAQHAANERGDVQELRQVLEQQQRRVNEVERAREAEESRHRRDSQQLRQELDELRIANGTLRGDKQLVLEEMGALKEEMYQMQEQLSEEGNSEGGGSRGTSSDEHASGASAAGHDSIGTTMLSELREQLGATEQELVTVKSQLVELSEREAALAEKNVELETILSRVSSKNRELQAKLASNEDTASSRGDRVVELQSENSVLMQSIQESRATATQARADAESHVTALNEAREELEAAIDNAAETETALGEEQTAHANTTQEKAEVRQPGLDSQYGPDALCVRACAFCARVCVLLCTAITR